jgi:hypothetical protein
MKVIPVPIGAPTTTNDTLATLIWRGPIWRRFAVAA